MTDHQPEGTQLVTQLGDAVGGPEVPADPETPASDRRHAEWEMRRMAESFVMTGGIRGQIGAVVLEALSRYPSLVAAVLDRPTIDGEPSGEAGLGDDSGRALTRDPDRSREHAGMVAGEGSDGSDAEAEAEEPHMDLLEMAWGVIANAGWNDDAKTTGWQEAAERWRDDYHRWLDLHLRPGGYQTWEELAVSVTRERDALLFEVTELRRALRDAPSAEPLAITGTEGDEGDG